MAFNWRVFTGLFKLFMYFVEQYLGIRQFYTIIVTSELNESAENGIKSKEYVLSKLTYGFLVDGISLIVNFSALYICPIAYEYFEDLPLTDNPYLSVNTTTMLIFIAMYTVVEHLVPAPFSIYYDLYIEQAYESNPHVTFRSCIFDIFKKLILGILNKSCLYALTINVIEWGGKYFYFYTFLVGLALSLVFFIINEALKSKKDNKTSELPDGTLKNKIIALAVKFELPLKKIYINDAVAYNAECNKFLHGFLNNKRIIIPKKLLQKLSEDEIVALISHAVGHWYFDDAFSMFTTEQLFSFVWMLCFSYFMETPSVAWHYGFNIPASTFVNLVCFSTIYAPAELITSLATRMISREYERRADEFSIKNRYYDLSSAIKKLSSSSLSGIVFDEWYSMYYHSHSPVNERLAAISKIMIEQKKTKLN